MNEQFYQLLLLLLLLLLEIVSLPASGLSRSSQLIVEKEKAGAEQQRAGEQEREREHQLAAPVEQAPEQQRTEEVTERERQHEQRRIGDRVELVQ